eukprot:gene3726-4247_t
MDDTFNSCILKSCMQQNMLHCVCNANALTASVSMSNPFFCWYLLSLKDYNKVRLCDGAVDGRVHLRTKKGDLWNSTTKPREVKSRDWLQKRNPNRALIWTGTEIGKREV